MVNQVPERSDSMQRVQLSIILPTFNRENFLTQALDSISTQTFTDWELIIIDDGSTDRTSSLISDLIAKRRSAGSKQHVRYLYQENRGAYAARNNGLDLAKGKYIAFFDSDDIWLSHHLKDCVDSLEENSDVDWVYGASECIDQRTGKIVQPNTFYLNGRPRPFLKLHTRRSGALNVIIDKNVIETMISHGLFCGLQNSVCRATIFSHLRFLAFRVGEDRWLSAMAAKFGFCFAYFENVHVKYQIHDNHTSGVSSQLAVEKRIEIQSELIEGYENLSKVIQLTSFECNALKKRLSKEYFWHLGYSLLWQHGKYQEALKMFKKGLQLWPWDMGCWKTYLLSLVQVEADFGLKLRFYTYVLRLDLIVKQTVVKILSFYLRRSPIEFARWRLLNLAVPLSREVFKKEEYKTIEIRHGFKIRINLGDWLGRHVYVTGEYEPGTTQVMKSLLEAGDTVIDIGANIGYFTLLAARCVGYAGIVLAFEPLQKARDMLEKNVKHNHMTNVVIRKEAVSNNAIKQDFFVGPLDHLGISGFRPLENAQEVLQVTSQKLDDLLPHDKTIKLVKIDIEGNEYRVLEGMQNCILRDFPDLIIEVSASYLRELGNSSEELCMKLLNLGYYMYKIEDDGLVPITRITEQVTDMSTQFNALFTVRSELPSSLRIKIAN